MSPARGASPFTRNVAAAAGVRRSLGTSGTQSAAIFSITGNPFSAYVMAGSSSEASGMVPNFSSSVTQPSNAPGTVIASMPVDGIVVMCFDAK
jgi:hypothetical protein